MGRYRSRSTSYSPARRKRYDDPRDRHRRDRRSPPAPSGLLIRNISLDARPEDLRGPFGQFGPIKDVYLPKNYYTGEPRGFGFVKFRYAEDAAEAKQQLNHTVIGGREIRIVFAEENRKTPQKMRRLTRTRGSYRRRSPSRSPRRRYHSYSRSPSPARRDSRDHGPRDDYYSKCRSRSVSPRSEGDRTSKRSPRRSTSLSRSPSPRDERNYRPSHKSPSPGENGLNSHNEDYRGSQSRSPREIALSLSRSRSRSYSPR